MQVALALAPGSVMSLVAGVHDLLQHCMRYHSPSSRRDFLYAVLAEGDTEFRGRFSFIEQHVPARSPWPDWVFVPALVVDETWCMESHRALADWLSCAASRGARVVGVGTGAFLMAQAGLFQQGRAVTHSQYSALFRHKFPKLELVVEPAWLETGNVICSGDLPWQELVLAELARHWGDAAAREAAETYALQWNHLVHSPDSGSVADSSIIQARRWLAEHYAEDNLIARCIERLGLCRRTFNRRFKQETGMSPRDYVQLLRIQASQSLLASTRHSVEDIGCQVGYSDMGAFYRLFRRYTGVSPGQFRRSHGAVQSGPG